MSHEERTGIRDLTYSTWHRTRSIARYVGLERAQSLSMIDADVVLSLEIDRGSRAPLALVEVAIDVGQEAKPASATARLASMAGIPAYAVLYKRSSRPNPADPREQDLESVRVQRIWPAPEHSWRSLTPAEWAAALVDIRSWSAARLEPAANDPAWERAPLQEDLFIRA